MKVTHYLNRNPNKIINLFNDLINNYNNPSKNIIALARYCSYDNRNRLNFEQEMDRLFSLS